MSKSSVVRGAEILVDDCLNIVSGEDVLIVTDTNMTDVAEVIAAMASERDADVSTIIMAPLSAPGVEPPKSVAAAMKTADVVMMPTTYSLAPSVAREEAQKAGARILSLGAYHLGILESDALRADYKALKPMVEEVANRLTKAENASVHSGVGTIFHLKLGKRKAHALSNVCHGPGTMGSPPDIEAYVAPIEDTAEGVVFIDGAINLPEFGLIREAVRLTVEEGRVISIDGGEEARRFEEKLESYDDSEMYRIAELGIGLNSKAKLVGDPLIDEGALGTAHIALGLNYTYGGAIRSARAHIDCVFREPTIVLDGETLLRSGELILET